MVRASVSPAQTQDSTVMTVNTANDWVAALAVIALLRGTREGHHGSGALSLHLHQSRLHFDTHSRGGIRRQSSRRVMAAALCRAGQSTAAHTERRMP